MSEQPPGSSRGADALCVRDAREADLPRIVAIYNSTVPGRQVTADLEPVSVESRRAWFDAHHPQRRPLWILEDRAKEVPIIGWLSLSDFYGRPAYQATAEVSIYLAEEARGRGHGRRLLARAIEKAPGLAVETLLGFIFGHNESSLELFRRMDFERWGVLSRVARLDDSERDLVIVGRRIA